VGGADGGGGQQTDGRPTCAELETSYANALPAARRCEVNGLKQCQQPVSSTLSTCPGCTTYVNAGRQLHSPGDVNYIAPLLSGVVVVG
jgi:hypothetical protein